MHVHDPIGIASKFLTVGELGDITARITELLHRHGNMSHCAACAKPGPCDMFKTLALQLRLIELIDGTRTTPGWAGPVEERRF